MERKNKKPTQLILVPFPDLLSRSEKLAEFFPENPKSEPGAERLGVCRSDLSTLTFFPANSSLLHHIHDDACSIALRSLRGSVKCFAGLRTRLIPLIRRDDTHRPHS